MAAAKRGYELIAHNFIQTEFMINYREDREKEKAVIKRVLDLIEKTTGKRPEGLAVVVAPLHGDARSAGIDATLGGIGLGGILVIVGALLAIFWSLWIGIIVVLVGLIAFGGFARGRWY